MSTAGGPRRDPHADHAAQARLLFAGVPGVEVRDDPRPTSTRSHRGRRQRRHLRRRVSGPTRPSPTGAGWPSGSSPTTSARGRGRTPSRSPSSSWPATGSGRRRVAPRSLAGVTVAERRRGVEAIAAEVRACTRCRLHESRTQPSRGGPPQHRGHLRGRGPGLNEDRQGRPSWAARGAAGRLLASIGWRMEDVFITNVDKCRPPENRDPEPDEIAACAPYLQRQLAALDAARW